MNKKIQSVIHIIVLLGGTFIVYCFFFGTKGFVNLKTNFTTTSGDFVKDFYNTYYHVKYDTTFLYNNTMNYPYGDHFTFTGDNAYLSFPMIVLKRIGVGDFSSYILPLINLHVFISIFLCAIFLYLLLRELKIPVWGSCLAAILITFLSPQMMRMWGHLTLTYMFILPAMLYFFYKIYQKQRYIYAIFLGILTFWASIAHAYYFLYFFIFNFFFWGYLFYIRKKENHSSKKMIYFICIQFIIPAILFFALTSIGIIDNDRTQIPYGFDAYKGCLQGTFLPSIYYSYTNQLKWSIFIQDMRASYIGAPALIMFLILVINICIKIVKRKFKELLKVTDHPIINLFFWISGITLIFAYGFPMCLLSTRNFVFLGPLAQIRGLDRYQWLFFYLINIMSIYGAYYFMKEKISKKWVQISIAALIFCAYSFEVYAYNRYAKYWFNEDWAELVDYDNNMEVNQWVAQIDSIPFQSMLVLPFFHIGSEHIWIDCPSGLLKKAIYVSLKTGIPMHDCYSSRTSISNSYKNVPFKWEPSVNGYPVLKDMKREKPILLITSSDKEDINESEWRIINYATYLFSENNIDFYTIDVPTLEQLCEDYFAEQLTKFNENKVYQYKENLYGKDADAQCYFYKWNDDQTFPKEGKKDGLKLNLRKLNHLFCDEINFQNVDSVEISFWVSNFTDDFVGRSDLYLGWVNSNWKSNYWLAKGLFRITTNLYNGWAIVRVVVPYFPDYPILPIDFACKYSRSKDIFIDFLLIRPIHTDILYEDEHFKMINNDIIAF